MRQYDIDNQWEVVTKQLLAAKCEIVITTEFTQPMYMQGGGTRSVRTWYN